MEDDKNTITEVVEVKTPVKKGRPKKADVLAKKKGHRGAVGRPVGDAGRIAEFKARLLAAPTANKIIDKILSIAYDDNHPGQMAALKMTFDRLLPQSVFEKDASGGKPSITINVTGMVDISQEQESNVIDMDSE